MMKPPCYGCNNRDMGCHALCDAYKIWAAARAEARDEMIEQKGYNFDVVRFGFERSKRITNRNNVKCAQKRRG